MAETDRILFTHPHVEAFPIGSIFLGSTNTNPSELLGYGTWELIGNGRTILGASEDDEGEETGGSMSKSLSASNIPGHTHSIPGHTHSIPSHSHSIPSHTHSIPGHTHQVPAHNHTASSASAGSHSHSTSGGNHTHTWYLTNDYDTTTGSWRTVVKIQSDNKYTVDSDAGTFGINNSGAHSHTVNSAGSHTHTITVNNKAAFNTTSGGSGNTGSYSGNTGSYSGTSGSGGSGNTGSTGSGTAFDITPSYIKLFIWKRIE